LQAGKLDNGRKSRGKIVKVTMLIFKMNYLLHLTGSASEMYLRCIKQVEYIFPSNRRKLMDATKRRYSREEFARRGDAPVESKVRPHLTLADEDNFVAIDIETGEYELDKNEGCRAATEACSGCANLVGACHVGLSPSLRPDTTIIAPVPGS
jgi:hypothetical protein